MSVSRSVNQQVSSKGKTREPYNDREAVKDKNNHYEDDDDDIRRPKTKNALRLGDIQAPMLEVW